MVRKAIGCLRLRNWLGSLTARTVKPWSNTSESLRRVRKKTPIVVLGKRRAIKLYYLLLGCTYLFTCVGVLFKTFPVFALITLLTLPLAYKTCKVAMKNFDRIFEVLPANAATIALHVTFGLLLAGDIFWMA